MGIEENKLVIQEIYSKMEEGDRAPFARHVAPDYVWRFPSKASWSRTFSGQQAIRDELLGPLFTLFEGQYTARLISMVAEGDTVVAEIEGHVMLKSGDLYDNQYCMLFRFQDGKIVEVVEYCDTDLEERVLGPYDDALKSYRQTKASVQ